MSRALITNAYSAKNAGDAAIMLATADFLRSLGHDEVRLATRYADEDREFYAAHGIETAAPAIEFPVRGGSSGFLRGLRFALSSLSVLLLCALHRVSRRLALGLARLLNQRGFVEVATADLAVLAGGGYLYSSQRRIDLTLMHHALTTKCNTQVAKQTIMMPQSIGPITSHWDAWLVRWALRGVRPVVVRDEPSLLATGALVPKRRVLKCPDVAFFGWPPALVGACAAPSEYRALSYKQSNNAPTVCFVMMDWSWARAGGAGQLERFKDEMALAINGCLERGYRVVCAGHSHLASHGQDDVNVARSILERARATAATVESASSPDDLRAIYRDADVVVGTRMHACILSLLEGVPALALAYQPKTTGLYEQLGLAAWCDDVEMVTAPALLADIEAILANRPASRERVRVAVEDARTAIVETYRGAGRR